MAHFQYAKRCNTTHQDLFSLMVEFDVNFGVNSPINFIVQSSFIDAELNILHLISGGLGLPDRDYYLLDSKKEIRESYICFIKKYGLCFGIELDSLAIFNLEKQLTEKTVNASKNDYIDNLFSEIFKAD